jgi:quercetin dioxygenase-like cupin family protein
MTTSQQPDDALAGKLKRTELQHSASSIPGREIVQVLTETPCGVESGWHIHPGEEAGYILARTVQMMIQGQPALTLHAGDPFLMPPRTTRWTLAPRQATCPPPTSSKQGSRWRRSLMARRPPRRRPYPLRLAPAMYPSNIPIDGSLALSSPVAAKPLRAGARWPRLGQSSVRKMAACSTCWRDDQPS